MSFEHQPWNRWYKTKRWLMRRELQLKQHPLCATCLSKGWVVPANVADHVVSHKGNSYDMWFGKLQSLCNACHARKDTGGSRGFDSDIGADGFPIDQRHPFHKHK